MKSLSLSSSEKLNIIENLGTLLTAGIPILEAVDSLLEETKGNTTKILETLKEDLNQGKTIAYSLTRHPKAFDPITVNLIKAAEEAGTLETALKDLTLSIKKDIDFAGKVKGSMVYPIVVLVVLFAVILLNLFFVIPRVAQVFDRLTVTVPLPTKILIFVSNFANDNLIYVIATAIFLIAASAFTFKVKRSLITGYLFSLPLISKLIMEMDITRFTRSMSLLLKSGLPIDEAIEPSEAV